MSNIEAFINSERIGSIPFVFNPEKVLAPDNVSVQIATHGMWLAAEAHRQSMNILDLGSGSGIMAVSAMLAATGDGEYTITAVDIDRDSVETTELNLETAKKYASAKIGYQVLQSDWFKAVEGESYDLILCNPPYLARSGKISFEEALKAPKQSIYADEPTHPYRTIAHSLQAALTDFGIAVFRTEFSETNRDSIVDTFNANGFRATRIGLHDGTREGMGLTVYRHHIMPPGLALPVVQGTRLDLSYDSQYTGGIKKPLSEAGKYWKAVAGYDLPD